MSIPDRLLLPVVPDGFVIPVPGRFPPVVPDRSVLPERTGEAEHTATDEIFPTKNTRPMACSTFDSDQKNIDDEFEMEDREIQKSIERGPNPPIPSQIAIDPSD